MIPSRCPEFPALFPECRLCAMLFLIVHREWRKWRRARLQNKSDVLKTNRLQQHNASWLTELHPTIAVLKVGHS